MRRILFESARWWRLLGRYAEAARRFGLVDIGKLPITDLLASLGHIGDRRALAEPLASVRCRGWDLMDVMNAEPYRDEAIRERRREGLRRALAA